MYKFGYNFDITLYPFTIDVSKIETLYPYDTNSTLYKRHTGSKSGYIDINYNPLVQIANNLWKESGENYLQYAYFCYLHVAQNYTYKNPNTGIHPIRTIILQGGGDCGNLASIFVNLLRIKGMPARHIITVRPTGSYHVWADFYLENYGWIPVDVNMKLDDPWGNYFGYCRGDGIVVSKDLCHQIDAADDISTESVILQNYLLWYWWYWGSSLQNAHIIEGTEYDINLPNYASSTHNSVIYKCTPLKGLTYKVNLENKTTGDSHNYEFDSNQDQILLDGLSPQTYYEGTIDIVRKVDNLEATVRKMNIVFGTDATGINDVVDSIILSVDGGRLIINNSQPGNIAIYKTDGNLYLKQNLDDGNSIIPMPDKGIYIVKIVNPSYEMTQKIVVQ